LSDPNGQERRIGGILGGMFLVAFAKAFDLKSKNSNLRVT
jgi:hypothetical protein